jgi:rhamnosyltransferase
MLDNDIQNIKVLAYITAFEDSKSVVKCISALQNQSYPIDTILIVDNSSVQPILDTDFDHNYQNIVIKYHPENIGVGGGLELALDFAKSQEYDFLWTFDQDSIPADDCLEILVKTYFQLSENQSKIGIIAPTAVDLRTNSIVEGAMFQGYRFMGLQHNHQVDFYECDAPITSGSLIPVTAVQLLSLSLAKFVIDGVDFELGMQLKQREFSNVIVTPAIVHHNFGNPIQVSFFKTKKNIQLYSAFRYYYICRNHTFLELHYAHKFYFFWAILWRIKLILSLILQIQFYDKENKFSKIKACLLGTYHGSIGKLGKVY